MPPLAVQFGYFFLGLIILAVGAELFIRGAVRVARRFGVSPFMIGLTLVGLGTSAPELVVNLSAALSNQPDLALGNIVGSNISNVGLILGVAALLRPLAAQMRLLKIEMPAVIVASVVLYLMARDGTIDRIDGLILLAGFVAMMAFLVRSARRESPEVKAEIGQSVDYPARGWVSIVMLIVGLAGLVGGAELMVTAAVNVAEAWGVSKVVIGLTIVAIGTSLPELAATVAAALRGESDIAVGNVVGSNLFNILLILGITATAVPLPVEENLRTIDLPVMIGFAFLLLAVLASGLRVHRWEGAILLAAFTGFIAWQVRQSN